MHKYNRCDATETRKCKTCIQYGWECTFNDVNSFPPLILETNNLYYYRQRKREVLQKGM